MRWDSPFVLSSAGTIAVHLILLVVGDAVQVYTPPKPPRPAPRIEMFDIEVPPPPVEPPPPPPPVAEPEPPAPEPEPVKQVEPPKQRVTQTRTRTTETPAPTESTAPPSDTPPTTDPSGGEQVVQLDSAQLGPGGVAVAVGRRTSERVGRGGSGGGTGTGTGAGAAADPPKAVSVATIKKRALPKGDQSYFDAGKDYPPEARQLAIEGVIRVRLVVDETGKVVTATLLNKLGHGLDELALERAKRIEFTPAIDTSDQPVTSVVVWTFNMTLPK